MFLRAKLVFVALAVVALVAVGCTPTPAPATPTVPPPTATTPPTAEPPTPTVVPPTEVPTATATNTPSSPIPTPISPLPTPISSLATPALPAGTAAVTPTVAAGSAPSAGGLPDIIVNAQTLQMQAGGFRADMTIDTGAGTVVTNTIEYQLPDRIHMITPAGEFIAIRNQGTWQKTGSTWQKAQVDLGAAIFDDLNPQALDKLRQTLDVKQGTVKDLGMQTVNGKQAHAYQYESSITTNGTTINSTTTLWIDPASNLPLQSEIVSDPLVPGGAKTKTTITYTYDPNIKIQAPQ
jgi:outer membrane lipoprotein-sorting protein